MRGLVRTIAAAVAPGEGAIVGLVRLRQTLRVALVSLLAGCDEHVVLGRVAMNAQAAAFLGEVILIHVLFDDDERLMMPSTSAVAV